jgi:hypothetical protein
MYDHGRIVIETGPAPVWTLLEVLATNARIRHDGGMADSLQAGSVRVGAADRTLVAERLVAHYQAGRLPRQELELRLTRVAHARTDDDLHRLTIDLPDVPGPARPISLVPRPAPEQKPPTSPLRVAFDVIIMLLTFSAAVCLTLLLIVAGAASSNGSGGASGQLFFVAALAAFGAFTVGAGSVHLIYRAFGKK